MQVHRNRLMKLAKYIRKVPHKNFDMGVVYRSWDFRDPPVELLINHTCGTAACALGYTPVIFPELVTYIGNHIVHRRTGKGGMDVPGPLFAIDDDTIDWLFTPEAYRSNSRITPKRVARRLEYYAKHGKINKKMR